MTDKQKIRQEIEKEMLLLDRTNTYDIGRLDELNHLLLFIDSIPEEPVSEDLEEEIENYIKDSLDIKFPTTDKEQIKADIRYIARHFAEWQRQKDQETIELAEDHAMLAGMEKMREEMMKDAVDAAVHEGLSNKYIKEQNKDAFDKALANFEVGDKVKIIIVKED